jgi:hypothetical protein
MKKKIVCALAFLSSFPYFSAAQLINNGPAIVVTSGTYLVLDNISLHNNGLFDQTAGTVIFRGNANAFLTGSISPQFYSVILDKPAATLQLQTNITVKNQLQFINGLLQLNTHNILLQPAALLNGETESSHIITSSGYVEITKVLNAPSGADPGNLGAIITSSQDLGQVTIRRSHQSQVNSTGGGNSILRHFEIIPANNIALNATLRFRYLDAELNGLDENLLTIWKRSSAGNWANLGRTSNSAGVNYVELTGISDFTLFTLSTPINALPLVWGAFNTQCTSGQVRVSWKTEREQNTALFIIRRSTNGKDWSVIATLPAAGNSNAAIPYIYTDQQLLQGTSYYQVQEQDIDGRKRFSPVLVNKCGREDGVVVYPNPVYGSCWVNIQSATAGIIMMRLYDTKGVLVLQRRETIQSGNSQLELHLDLLIPGVYSLVVTQADGRIKAVKIDKR